MSRFSLLLAAATMLLGAGCASPPSPAELDAQAQAMVRASFRSEGIASLDRLTQDDLQQACSSDTPPSAQTAARLQAQALATLRWPADGNYIGNWREGEKLAQNGRGMTWTDPSAKPSANGGQCYNCHQIDQAEISYGTIGPSLWNYGKLRGVRSISDPASAAVIQYTWGKLWNAKAYAACSNMPRFGHNALLDENQLRHVMALLLDPGVAGQPLGMSLRRREFAQVLGAASVAGMALADFAQADAATAQAGLYDLPRFGQVGLLHLTDCHAQLLPMYFREPSANLGVGAMQGRLPHLVGRALLRAARVAPGSAQAYAFSSVDFETAARRYGRVGGFAHLATLVKQLKASRPGALLLDGGDTWQGSATALWTEGQDMVDAAKLLGVDVMTGHWEFTYGMARVKHVVEHDFKGHIDFVAQNVRSADFDDPVFSPWVMRQVNGVAVAIVGQAFPYTPIANPRYFVADWRFGIQEENLQRVVDDARAKGAQLVVLLSHNGMDVDLKLASRVRGIDVVLGGHTHDGVPVAVPVKNAGGTTLVTNSGSHGKFLGVMDLEVKGGRMVDYRWRLLPVFANQLRPDAAMQALITQSRAPYAAKLGEELARSDGLLYRRGNFNGSWDQLICDALIAVQGADIAFSPGFRWGTTLLPGDVITREALMDQLAITYPWATLTEMSGQTIKDVLEDVADNLFNPDPYYQQGGDMVRVGGLAYTMTPGEAMGRRISDMRLKGRTIEAGKTYKVAGWAPVAEAARDAGNKPVWELVETWLRSQGGRVAPRRVESPRLIGVDGNPGLES